MCLLFIAHVTKFKRRPHNLTSKLKLYLTHITKEDSTIIEMYRQINNTYYVAY